MMLDLARSLLLIALLAIVIPAASHSTALATLPARSVFQEKFVRSELYFGLTKPDKSTLTDSDWAQFVDEVITPRFPAGFTVLDAKGQWRTAAGGIAKENSKVFIVVYPRRERSTAGKKLDEIRAEYKKRFEQESVLRVDVTRRVLVSF